MGNRYFILCLSIFAAIELTKGLRICPAAAIIHPCTCREHETENVTVACSEIDPNSPITQADINHTFRILRNISGAAEDEWISLTTFSIVLSDIKSLDLTPFTYFQFKYIFIYGTKLSTITGPPLDRYAHTIEINHLEMFDNNLTDAGFGNTLRYIHNLEYFILHESITGSSDGDEFLAGLGSLHSLQDFNLDSNRISGRIPGGQFKNNTALQILSLANNQIQELSENAFQFEESPFPDPRPYLFVNLAVNRLTDEGIHSNHGLDKLNISVHLSLERNNLTTLSKVNFHPFLKAGGILYLDKNPLLCDIRVKWLKDEKDMFEDYVMGAHCANDPGYTIFNSTLIPR